MAHFINDCSCSECNDDLKKCEPVRDISVAQMHQKIAETSSAVVPALTESSPDNVINASHLYLVIGRMFQGTAFCNKYLYKLTNAPADQWFDVVDLEAVDKNPTKNDFKRMLKRLVENGKKYTNRNVDISPHMVIYADSDKRVSAEVKARAEFIIFTNPDSMQEYFGRVSNNLSAIRNTPLFKEALDRFRAHIVDRKSGIVNRCSHVVFRTGDQTLLVYSDIPDDALTENGTPYVHPDPKKIYLSWKNGQLVEAKRHDFN